MKHLRLLMPVILTALLVTSCASQKRAWYLQDAQPFTPEQIAENGQIRIKPLDRLTIVVNSKDPELAVPFNSSSSLSSLTGATNYGSATNQSLQIRTVDENGQLEMPVIGKIECKGKTRSELAQAIADKIVEGGYINDPTVNVQFADMKISVIGEVARPGHYDVTRDKLSIFDALAMAGDLTIYGIRTDVAVAREVDGVRTIEYLDLTSKELFNSPAFYIQQNDVIYVKPNKYKAQTGEISQNRNFYLSLASTAISVATLIVTLTKVK
ncbi:MULTISPECIES: polysaccharide biosynthesis/export family protein [Alistipes]|uniref:polysaccharide biosynthesis/export family protein n=1 Tax=Alistipes TaxID=239759 RepID=UPI0023F07AC2|nr:MULTISPECIES: polysaccharide biosynthesis/export family protein [Alistipes]